MDSLRSQIDTEFNVYIEMGVAELAAPIKQWLLDCADLKQVFHPELASLQIWDWAAFQYHKQLGDILPRDLIVIDSSNQAQIEQQVLMHGAEYAQYPADVDTLLLRLSLHIQRIRYVHTLESLTVTDPLTGVFNRRKFDQELDTCWRQGKRQNTPCSLLFVDVDYFKRFNDRYGHLAGDQCLRELADIFKQAAVRPHDVAARIGGEEFAIILPDTPETGALYVAQQIMQVVARREILNEDTPLGRVSVSIGVATVLPDGAQTLKSWQQQADDALYSAKAAGRNQVMKDVSDQLHREAEVF
jgi:diguanylate cyclase (GGDEF)-like protein